MCPDSSVYIATRYGLDGLGIESRWGPRFSAPVQTSPGAHPGSYTMGTASFPGVKRPGRGADHPPPSKRRGHEKVGLYLYSPSGSQWPVIGRTFAFTFIRICGLQMENLNFYFERRQLDEVTESKVEIPPSESYRTENLSGGYKQEIECNNVLILTRTLKMAGMNYYLLLG